ncbi:hypothetical protein HID58_004914 [Brassica napus]|uniref:Uncharacterized protein n=1 Tax=Brassica napus TaxID=3708 RepID=A0ABQ8E744_BRANA|nr:hypothetical protein HID58_004914 [Brassica napus]
MHATALRALPCSAKIWPLMSNKAARSIPGPRGFAPMRRAHSTSWNTSYGSVPISTSLNKGNKESSSSIATPSRAWIDLSDPRSFKAMGWSGPNTEPEASYTR